MNQIQEVVGKLRKGSQTKSIGEDLRKPENSLIFSEESSRIILELGNIELYELGQMSSTIQCHSCFKHMPEGLGFCPRGLCLRSDEATVRITHARFQTLNVTGTRALFRWRVTHKIVKKDLWTPQKISNPLRKLSEVFDKDKDDRFHIYRRRREEGKDHSTKNCRRT